MPSPLISIITPTTGSPSLLKLLESLYSQDVDFEHIVLWDEKRETCKGSVSSLDVRDDCRWERSYNIEIPDKMVQGVAAGSALRSIGLMASRGKYVTFADSDVWYDKDHLKHLLTLVKETQWGFCRRKIWNNKGEFLGVDNFESVGACAEKRVPYLLVDNNTMIFERRFGVSASSLYRETEEYNDDRLMTKFLYQYAGIPGMSREATVNQVCPDRLEEMFSKYCTK